MFVLRHLIIVFMVSLLTLPAQAEYCAANDYGLLDSIVRITGEDTIASGVVVAPNKIITAAHVIDELNTIYVEIDGIATEAQVTMVYPEKDFAILEVNTGHIEHASRAQDVLSLSSIYWAVGYPLGGGKVINPGLFSSYADGDIHTTASVNFGQSGGGLFLCENGNLVLAGMVTGFAAIDHGDYYERLDNHSIALSITEVSWMIDD